MSYVDTSKFIEEVKKRPAIYNGNPDDANDKELKAAAWREVCEAMIPSWHSLSEEDKKLKDKTVRGKWRNIRDYFTKELRLQRREKDFLIRKRKPYVYFNQLLFMLPNVQNKYYREQYLKKNFSPHMLENTKTHIKTEDDSNEIEIDDRTEEFQSIENASTSQSYIDADGAVYSPTSNLRPPLCELENDMHEMFSTNSSQKGTSDEEDYDKMFLLSLLPSMRQVPEEQKLMVRIQMQQILAAAIYPKS